MQVNDLYTVKSGFNKSIEVSGYLVVIEDNLFLINSDYGDNYKESEMLLIKDPDIKYLLKESLLPLGGESFVFHKANLIGLVVGAQQLAIEVEYLEVQERGCGDWIKLDLSSEHLLNCKNKHQPNDGFNFFEEMGD